MSDLLATGDGRRLITASHSAGEPVLLIEHPRRNILAEILMRAMAQRNDIMRRPVHTGPGQKHTAGLKHHKSGVRYPANQARECARRRRQINAGQLKAENGYVFDHWSHMP